MLQQVPFKGVATLERSETAQCDLAPAVEIRKEGRQAGRQEGRKAAGRKEGRKEGRRLSLKTNNPQVTGGEKQYIKIHETIMLSFGCLHWMCLVSATLKNVSTLKEHRVLFRPCHLPSLFL